MPSLRGAARRRGTRWSAVLTRPDAPAGRGRRLVRSPVGARADEAGVPVLTPRRPADPDFLDALRALAPDCCPVVAYGALVPRAALDVPPHGWVNLHFSLLPAWRGAARCRPRSGRRRDHRRHDVPGSRRGWTPAPCSGSPRRSAPTTPRRPPGAARRVRGRAAGGDDGRDRGRHAAPGPAARRRVSSAPKVTVADARDGLGAPRRARGPAGALGHPGAGGVDDLPGRAPGGSARCRSSRAPELKPGELHVEKRRVLVGTAGTPWSSARCARSGADARSGLGARRPDRSRRAARRMSASRPPCDERGSRRAGRNRRAARRRGGAAVTGPGARAPASPRPTGPGAPPWPVGTRRARPGAEWPPSSCSPRSACGTPTPTSPDAGDPAPAPPDDGDAALATELGYGTLRAQGLLDAVIEACVDRPLRESTRRCSTPCGWAPTSCCAPVSRRTPRSTRPSSWSASMPGSRAAGSSTRCCAGSRGLDDWLAEVAPPDDEDPDRPRGVRARPPPVDRAGVRGRARRPAGMSSTRARRRRRAPGGAPAGSPRRDHRRGAGTGHRRRARAVLAVRGAPATGAARSASWTSSARVALVQDEGSQLVALGAGRGAEGRGPGRAVARPVRRARWQGGAARRAGGARAGPLDAVEVAEHRARLVRAGRRRAPGPTRCSPPTGGPRRWPTAPSTGSWSTPRAPGWARCAAGRRPGGGAGPRTCPASRSCSASC